MYVVLQLLKYLTDFLILYKSHDDLKFQAWNKKYIKYIFQNKTHKIFFQKMSTFLNFECK